MIHITIWEPNGGWRNFVGVCLLIILSPLIVVAFLLIGLAWVVTWPIRKLFPPTPPTAGDFAANLTRLMSCEQEDEHFEEEWDQLTLRKYADQRLEELRQKLLRLEDMPLDHEKLKALKAIRESAKIIAAGTDR